MDYSLKTNQELLQIHLEITGVIGRLKIAWNILFQLCDVQSGFDRTRRSVSAGETTES